MLFQWGISVLGFRAWRFHVSSGFACTIENFCRSLHCGPPSHITGALQLLHDQRDLVSKNQARWCLDGCALLITSAAKNTKKHAAAATK